MGNANRKQAAGWQNRIVGEGLEDADQLLANPSNWRIHSKSQQTALTAALDGIGWIQRVIVNRTTGHVIDGHLRAELAITRGEQVPVLYVELSEDEERLALATLDPLSAMAAADRDMLADLLDGLRETPLVQDDAALRALLGQVAGENGIGLEDDEAYSRKIEAPIYEPKNEKPSISELYDDTKTQALIADIQASDLPEDEKQLLSIAAQRHTVLNFSKMADYYAHSDEATQRLMEDSALVIIDFNRAIELGFVQVTKRLAEFYEEEYSNG